MATLRCRCVRPDPVRGAAPPWSGLRPDTPRDLRHFDCSAHPFRGLVTASQFPLRGIARTTDSSLLRGTRVREAVAGASGAGSTSPLMKMDCAARRGCALHGARRAENGCMTHRVASKKDRTSSAAGATSPTTPPAGSPTGEPGTAENGAGGAAGGAGPEDPAEGFNIVAARQAIPVLDRVLRAWDRALGAQHTPAGFAVEFVAHIEASRLERIRCASLGEIGRLAEELAVAYPLVPAADWRAALSAKRVKPRSSAGRSSGRTPRKAKTGTRPGAAGEGATGGAAVASPDTAAASAGLTPELRAQHRIPDWADGSDIRPGEELAAYARRKRAAGPPPDRSKFIGE